MCFEPRVPPLLQGPPLLIPFLTVMAMQLMRFACALLVVFFPFAIVGMQVFANTVSKCDASCGSEYSRVAGSEGYYQLNSFDNVGRAYVTLFELMIVNNWHLIMEVASACSFNSDGAHTPPQGHVSATGKASRLFFFCFYLLNVLVVVNVVIAYVLTAFQAGLPVMQASLQMCVFVWSSSHLTSVHASDVGPKREPPY